MSRPNRPIYLDNHATTPVDPRVLAAMRPWWEQNFANPGSRRARHGPRRRGSGEAGARPRRRADRRRGARDRVHLRRHRVEQPRHQGCRPLRARAAGHRPPPRRHARHRAQMRPGKRAGTSAPRASSRWCCRSLPDGLLDLDLLDATLAEAPTLLVSVMAVNNEIGVIQDLAAIGAIAKDARRAVPHRRGAGLPGASRSTWAAIRADLVSHLRATRSTGRRGSARSMSAAGRGCAWRRCSRAAGRSGGCARARCRRR